MYQTCALRITALTSRSTAYGLEIVFGAARLLINPKPEELWGAGGIGMRGGFTGRADGDVWRADTSPLAKGNGPSVQAEGF